MGGYKMASGTFKYRPDIDGLRAIAVLAVVLYHYGIGSLRGGFVGVDVFFVISGYLITGIIYREMQRNEFTLARFYERRARRIFPALFVMLLVTMVAGLFFLLPTDLANLGQSSIATVLFVSNMLYMLRSGYFDTSSDFNPLLHTWSLGVEEQFYLGLPLVLLLIARLGPRGHARILAVGALLSFVACAILQPVSPKLVFFLSPFRAWELLLGALLGIGVIPAIKHSGMREMVALVGLCALLGSIWLITEGIDFPGWKAAIPVAATALLLHTGSDGGSRVSRLLSLKPVVFIGLISYSLYLWHWPLFVLVKYSAGMQPLSSGASIVLLGAALLISSASYFGVERPFRKVRASSGIRLTQKQVFAASAGFAVVLLIVGSAFYKESGFPVRVPTAVAELDRERIPVIPYQSCDAALPRSRQGCLIGAQAVPGRPLALVWGDSHALAWVPGMDERLKAQQWAGVLAVNSACAPLLGLFNPKDTDCHRYNEDVLTWVKTNKPDRVYLIAAWFAWSNKDGYDLVDLPSGKKGNPQIFGPAFRRTIESIRPWVGRIVVIGPTPVFPRSLPYGLAISRWRHTALPEEISLKAHEVRAANFWHSVRPFAEDVQLIDPAPWFCSRMTCRYIDHDRLLFRDAHHLNVNGARFAANHLPEMRELPIVSRTEMTH